jgi:cytochrome c oxidase subunit 3
MQIVGCIFLFENGTDWTKTSGAFLYIIIGIHFLHIGIGLIGLVWVWFDSVNSKTYVDGFIQSLNPAKMTRFKLVSIYWHFLDVLWIFLFALLWMNQF